MRVTPARLAIAYVVVAGAWIIVSDAAVRALALDPDTETYVSVAKGWGFVLLTGALLLVLSRALVRQADLARAASDRAATQLADRESRLAAILDASPNPILTLDRGGTIRYANPASGRAFGANGRGLAGRPLADLLPAAVAPDHPTAVSAWFAALTDGGRPSEGARGMAHPLQVDARRLDGGTFPVQVLLAPVATPEGPLAIATLVDLSERAALEARIRQGERLETLGEFAGILAHDVRNYLTAVSWSADLLAHDLPEGDRRLADVELIRRAAADATSMTRTVLEFARPTAEVVGRTDLAEHLAQAEPLLRRIVGASVTLSVEVAADVPPVAVAGPALTQVLVNLATNARDAMPGGGTISIAARRVERGTRSALLGPGAYVRLTVADTGAGMDDETRARAFDPFFTTRAGSGTSSGTGLGLSSAYLILHRAGGAIDVTSSPGAGTTFTMDLPVGS